LKGKRVTILSRKKRGSGFVCRPTGLLGRCCLRSRSAFVRCGATALLHRSECCLVSRACIVCLVWVWSHRVVSPFLITVVWIVPRISLRPLCDVPWQGVCVGAGGGGGWRWRASAGSIALSYFGARPSAVGAPDVLYLYGLARRRR